MGRLLKRRSRGTEVMYGEGGRFFAGKVMPLAILDMGCLVSLRKADRGITCFHVWYVQLSCLL
jgi:hypothetical protein